MASRLGGAALGSIAERLGQSPSPLTENLTLSPLRKAPKTRFSHKISGHRVVEGLGLPMSAFKQLRSRVDGATVNDVFLALVGGSMQKYLHSKGELPNRSLNTMMPISLRTDASTGGNDVGFAVVEISTDVKDPLERLRACQQASSAAKQKDGLLESELPNLADMMPNFLTDLMTRHLIAPSINTVVSNVRGPNQPLYMTGAMLERIYPISIPTDHIGINHTAISYAGTMWLGVVACRDMLPDPGFYAQCIRESFNEMLVAAGVLQISDSAFTNAPKATAKRQKKAAKS
jgi:WS/DGAT/MGAT family acyltransferase